MPWRPRTQPEILTDMVMVARANSLLTDFNPGSQVRTLLETVSLELRELYNQMVIILKGYSYRNASGTDLDLRAADFNITRLPAAKAYGNIIIMDDGLSRTYCSDPIAAGTINIIVEDASVFSAPPVDVKIGEKTANEEDRTIASVTLATNTITLSAATTYAHDGISSLGATLDEWELGGARIAESDGSDPQVINSGLVVYAPPIGDLPGIEFITTKSSILLNGDFQTEATSILSSISGPDGNIGPKRVSGFPANPPFSNALVINTATTGGGSYSETDQQFVERIEAVIGSLSGATINSILATARGVSVPISGQKVGRVSAREEFVFNVNAPGDGRVSVYVDDGTGSFVPEQTTFPYGVVQAASLFGDFTIDLDVSEGILPNSGYVIINPSTATAEVAEFWAVTYTGTIATLSLTAGLAFAHALAEGWVYAEQVDDSTLTTNTFYNMGNIAIVFDELSLFVLDTSSVVTTLTKYDPDLNNYLTAHYLLAPGVGQIELTDMSVIPDTSLLYAWYSHYDGLIEEVQRSLDGDVRDPSNYPGVKPAGVNLVVFPPNYVIFNIAVELLLSEGSNPPTERERADRVIRNYVNALNSGESFIITEMIKRVKSANVYDLEVKDPTANVLADDNEVLVVGTLVVT